MILCICQAVTDHEVDAAIQGGARSAAEVEARCGAGGDCGACRNAIEERIEAGACGNRCADCPRAPAALASAAL
jgi:bacterioferritin-associated ferredoxin